MPPTSLSQSNPTPTRFCRRFFIGEADLDRFRAKREILFLRAGLALIDSNPATPAQPSYSSPAHYSQPAHYSNPAHYSQSGPLLRLSYSGPAHYSGPATPAGLKHEQFENRRAHSRFSQFPFLPSPWRYMHKLCGLRLSQPRSVTT